MTSREQIVESIRNLYAARARGDVDACMEKFSPDACFVWAGSPQHCPVAHEANGAPAVKAAFKGMSDAYEVLAYEHRDFIVEGERAAVLTDLTIRFTPTGETFSTQFYDLWTFKDGEVASFVQFGDTALAAGHAAQLGSQGSAP